MTVEERLVRIEQSLQRIEERLLRLDRNLLTNLRWSIDIMATQSEAAQQLTSVLAVLDKIGSETTELLAEVEELKAQATNVSPELQTAIDAVAERAQGIDDLVPDTPAPAPPPAQ